MSRRYIRNPSSRKAGRRKPGNPPPLYARVATPGMGGGVTVFILPLTSYGCRIAPPAGTPLDSLALLYGFVGGVWASPLCISITNAGEDGEGTLLRLEFNAELDAGTVWELNLNTTVPWIESPQGARLAGLVDSLASPPPNLWSEATNLSDAPPVPPDPPALWTPTNVMLVAFDTVQFETNGNTITAPVASDFILDGSDADMITHISGGTYQAQSGNWSYVPGDTPSLTMQAYANGWSLSDGSLLGPVWTRVVF